VAEAAASTKIRQQWKGLGENSLRVGSEKQQEENAYNSPNIGVSEFNFLTDCNSRAKQERNTKLEMRSELSHTTERASCTLLVMYAFPPSGPNIYGVQIYMVSSH